MNNNIWGLGHSNGFEYLNRCHFLIYLGIYRTGNVVLLDFKEVEEELKICRGKEASKKLIFTEKCFISF